MRKGDQTGEQWYRSLANVSKQIQHWGVDVWCMYQMEHYKKAKLSPAMHNLIFNNAAYDEYVKHYPQNLDLSMNQGFMDGDTHVLANHAEIIINAARRDDSEFFISLGKLLVRRKENKIYTSGMFAGPKSIPDLVNQLWMSGCLWLMTDTAALTFLNGVFGESIELAAYRKARTRPNKLFRHPESPILKIQWAQQATGHHDAKSDNDRFCLPVLKSGWRVSQGCFLKCEE